MVNYPHKVAKKTLVSTQRKHPVDFANRGMTFEKMINESNTIFLEVWQSSIKNQHRFKS